MDTHNIRGFPTGRGTPDDPVHVVVRNVGQMSQAAIDLAARQLRRPQTGPTGVDPRADISVMGYGP